MCLEYEDEPGLPFAAVECAVMQAIIKSGSADVPICGCGNNVRAGVVDRAKIRVRVRNRVRRQLN